MEHLSNVLAEATRAGGSLNRVSKLPEDWRLARAARANLLLIYPTESVPHLLELLLLDLPEPIATWTPGEPLQLPRNGGIGTVVLHEVGALPGDEQRRLLDWLERAAGRVQVVSTSPAPLLPHVQAGAFNETLYYRLNTVCVDVTA